MKAHELAQMLLEGPNVVVRVAGYNSYVSEATEVEYHEPDLACDEPYVLLWNDVPQI